ncbi:hypothetical protein GC105_11030 [Alkalibaculum sp. M08DMB]|uniref:serine-type D-Ala-D-Ala carboxypeptidase n=1 Tax=Alkalibaculum sporogenes TaxID=2655001 RepID=A0A6A7KAD5_9FIRM|nr:D-alanyl-D-alanine carboxypeptidase family protein [Alkalibaculum sporogenes]MPW26322.1 hypothetical protein [Alkalibaculum sporogenes]
MNKKIRIIILIMLLLLNSTAYANNLNFADDRGILLFEEKSDTVLYEQNSEIRFYPASTTKIMTALLVIENMNLDDKITVGNEVTLISADSSKAGIKQGEVLTVKELLYGLLIASGNDIANTLATNVGQKIGNVNNTVDSIDYFVSMMNERAYSLETKDTNFVNPHGLHDENQYSTPSDMLIITRELLKHEEIKEIVSTVKYPLVTKTSNYLWVNTNVLLHKNWDDVPYISRQGKNQYYSQQVNGIKTGFTNPAGRCIIFSANKNKMELLGLIYHSTYDDIWQESIDLMNFATETYSYINIIENNKEIDSFKISNPRDIEHNSISIITKKDIPYLLYAEDKNNIEQIVSYDEEIFYEVEDRIYKLKRNIKENEKVGQVTYSLDDKIIAKSEIYTANSIEKISFLDLFYHWQFLLLCFVLLCLIIRIYRVKRKRRKK